MSSTCTPHSFVVCANVADAPVAAASACRNVRPSLAFIMAPTSIRNRCRRVDAQPGNRPEQEQYPREIQRRVRVDKSLCDECDQNRAENRADLPGCIHRAAQRASTPAADIEARAPRGAKQ